MTSQGPMRSGELYARACVLAGPRLLVVALPVLAGCVDGPLEPSAERFRINAERVVVSEPLRVSAPSARLVRATSGASPSADPVAFISMPPRTFATAGSATLRNLANGQTATTRLIDGGFDPVTLPASTGDPIEITVTFSQGTGQAVVVVPVRRRPRLVRTVPPQSGTDVPLNGRIVVVFSEPVDPATINRTNIRLVGGPDDVAGSLVLSADGLTAELAPDQFLTPFADYALLITTDVEDLVGDQLEEPADIRFTTGSQLALQAVMGRVSHTCGLAADGTAFCWGSNAAGQLGEGPDTALRLIPIPVSGGLKFASLEMGSSVTCGVTTSGDTYCWGKNSTGLFGDGTVSTTATSGPVPVSRGIQLVTVSMGYAHACGLTQSGQAYCWGDNASGQLGDGTTQRSLSPVPVTGGLTFSAISAGGAHTCGLDLSGAAYCWGNNLGGQLGNGLMWSRAPNPQPVAVRGGWVFASIGAGGSHTCGLTPDGAAYCWGDDGSGQIGTPAYTVASGVPVAVSGGPAFSTLSVGGVHSCALTADGAAYCWGANNAGQIGNGATGQRWVQTPAPVAAGFAFIAVHAASAHTCALARNGIAWCWGANSSGQLGDGTTTPSGVPLSVVGPDPQP